jgi:hypothetical protein
MKYALQTVRLNITAKKEVMTKLIEKVVKEFPLVPKYPA